MPPALWCLSYLGWSTEGSTPEPLTMGKISVLPVLASHPPVRLAQPKVCQTQVMISAMAATLFEA